jgi:2-oxoglutarate ferredoxin oxidoreductase subunit alpha
VVRIAGDSGDGIQLTGQRFTLETALAGPDYATFPDFPAEIRAPAGTTFGVSAFQIQFGDQDLHTPGDLVDVLIVLNPAALEVNLGELKKGGLIVADRDAFTERNLNKTSFATDPLADQSLAGYRVLAVDLSERTLAAVRPSGVTKREGMRARNMWALGLTLALCERPLDATERWLAERFAGDERTFAANLAALRAGHAYGAREPEAIRLRPGKVAPATLEAGHYRNVSGAEALSLGLVTGARLAGLEMLYCSYPITPASSMLHILARLRAHGVGTFQAEDEIAAVCAAIGASYGGRLGVTGTSGPGMALKTEALGLAVAAELPLVVVDAQRGGPSTGLPTKTEQSDLFQAVLGRNADSPLPVVAARSPKDGFDCAIEATRLAVRYMTPVILLTDGYLASASEPWRLPDLGDYQPFPARQGADRESFAPYRRDPLTLARPWVVPGTPGLAHRIGGLERANGSGDVSYEPSNHARMTSLRTEKIARIAGDIPPQALRIGAPDDDLLILGWGSTYGAITDAVEALRRKGQRVAAAHLRHLAPFPANLAELLAGYNHVLVPELNTGQLAKLLQAETCIPVRSLGKVAGRPFTTGEIEHAALALLA